MDLEKINNLYFPAFSEEIETYVCPITKSYCDAPNGLRLADGWRYFNEVRVIQKKNNLLNLTIVFIISLVALILLLDTFKSPLRVIVPNIEFLLYNFYESFKDMTLFFRDLI